MDVNKLIISKEEAKKCFSDDLISLFIDTGKPITNFFGIDVCVTNEDIGKDGIAFKYPVIKEIETVLGLRIEQIAWMKQYFKEHMLSFDPPKEFIDQKLRECFSKQEDNQNG